MVSNTVSQRGKVEKAFKETFQTITLTMKPSKKIEDQIK